MPGRHGRIGNTRNDQGIFGYNHPSDWWETTGFLHFHETRQGGQANIQAALEMGVREFDSSIGGLGGSPFIVNTTGNIATEDIVKIMDEAGISTGIDRLV
ncbi:MAG: hypothetical protein CM1200mP10_13610 [Candidatus Neomarinimicrobiota bacterium]|nr:MAG: hypothetical protein CM1200mP10_13610 [Candidatus Neomarinimicrobiota bacterium]